MILPPPKEIFISALTVMGAYLLVWLICAFLFLLGAYLFGARILKKLGMG